MLQEKLFNYLLKTMLRSYRNSWECMRIEDKHYYDHFTRVFTQIILNSSIKINKNLPNTYDFVENFMFYDREKEVVHYIYTRNIARKTGIATDLLQEFVKDGKLNVSFLTKNFEDAFAKKFDIVYTPFKRYY